MSPKKGPKFIPTPTFFYCWEPKTVGPTTFSQQLGKRCTEKLKHCIIMCSGNFSFIVSEFGLFPAVLQWNLPYKCTETVEFSPLSNTIRSAWSAMLERCDKNLTQIYTGGEACSRFCPQSRTAVRSHIKFFTISSVYPAV